MENTDFKEIDAFGDVIGGVHHDGAVEGDAPIADRENAVFEGLFRVLHIAIDNSIFDSIALVTKINV